MIDLRIFTIEAKTLSALLAGLFVLNCASVRNYDDRGTRVGFRHYAPKFYLLIEPSKERAKTMRVVTLPDLSAPQFVKHKAGWGKVDFNFKLVNGVLTEFGQKVDSTGPETLAGIGTLGTAYGGILTGQAAKATAERVAGAAPGTTFTTISLEILVDVSETLQTKIIKTDPIPRDPTLGDVYSSTLAQVARLKKEAQIEVGTSTQVIEEIAKRQKATLEIIDILESDERKIQNYLDGLTDPDLRSLGNQWQHELANSIRKLRSFALPAADIEMYEIKPSPKRGGVTFERVHLGSTKSQ